ncbi:MAG: Cys-tRNA(Pro) deacylase [Clostridiales bacterium]|nr:MAG: Cys-tRNA(Pro) deacylase [Clostridiales bacterium]
MEGRQKYRLVPGEGVCYNGGNRKKNGGGAAVKKKTAKTNVMRQLDRAKIAYEIREYPHEEGVAVDGVTVARSLGQEPGSVFKTLVTRGASGGYYVFDVPVDGELDLKKAARAVGEKSVAMLHVAELLPLTGYVRGGCSPVGMKKQFPTVFHDSARHYDRIAVSAGKIGLQVLAAPGDLCRLVGGRFADVIK